ncbi:MAG TPA: hypothetical protein PKC18_08745, partial [Lacipirellulaceae bacterium]|nr:hypothetical protein [Lacipirellulaceae bacterium]
MRIWPSRRTAKRLGIALAMIAGLLLVANGVMAWRTEARSNALKAAIRAAGDPASIADLAPAPIPDSDNAAAQIAGLADALKAFGTDYRAFLERTDLGKAYDQSDALPTAEQAAAMRAILDKHSALSEGVSRAAACDAWASTADFTVSHDAFLDALLERVQAFRGAMRYAGWEIAVLTAEGKTDEAVRRGIDVLKLARLHEAEPTLVSYL